MKRLSPFRLLGLAARQTRREIHAGELRTLFFALVIAVAASCAIGYFGARLNAAMNLRATEFLGADLVLEGSSPATAEQREAGLAQRLEHAEVVEFSSVIAGDDGIQLSAIKAVDNAYPLRGTLKSALTPFAEEQQGGRPNPGEVWVELRLLSTLDLAVGDMIDVGAKPLKITRILTYEPDRAGNFYSLTPRVMMNLADLTATQVVQPGSRVSYRDLWRGDASDLARYRQRVEGQLAPNQHLLDAREGNQQIGGALERAERYLNLASLAAILLAGVAVALSANRFASKRYDASALLRSLGMSQRATLGLFILQLALLGLAASIVGILLGWLGQHGLFYLLRELLPPEIPSGGLTPALAGIATGLVALAGFAIPPLLALGRVPPLRVLRGDLQPAPASSWLIYGAALLSLGLIMWRLSLDLPLTLGLIGGGAFTALIFGGLLIALLRQLRRLLANASLPWRLGLGQLLRNPLAAAGQALAFGLILLAMALIALLRSELLDTWQAQLPDDAPNYFALNILSDQRETVTEHLNQLGAQSSPLYPVVPGRLTQINGESAHDRAEKDSQGDRALNRDLSLTWSAELPEDNALVQGDWWPDTQASLPGVSVEAELAESLQLKLGDQVTFVIAGVEHTVEVTSLRTVNWDSFRPNFYMIFQPNALADVPVTYLTSFYLPSEAERSMLEFSRAFPNVTLLQIDVLLSQLRDILAQVTLAIEYVLLFVLAAGLAVLLAGLQATLDERIRQGALLRALGAGRPLLQATRRSEFALLGACSGLVAAVGCELATYLIYTYALKLNWHPHPWLLLLPLIGAALVTAAGLFGTRQALNASPLSILRSS